jgi:acetylornithine/succinyldiaminopimelate/putrescine aminotransferase
VSYFGKVVGLGHCHKDITATIQTQAGELLHTSNWYHITHQETLAENSGAKPACTLSLPVAERVAMVRP